MTTKHATVCARAALSLAALLALVPPAAAAAQSRRPPSEPPAARGAIPAEEAAPTISGTAGTSTRWPCRA